jgi:hypothetical protein
LRLAIQVISFVNVVDQHSIEPTAKWCWTFGALHKGCGEKMQREYAIRQMAKREGFRLKKEADDNYRLINARFNVVVYHLDGVPLEKIAAFLEQPTSRANLPDAHQR